MPRIIVRFSGKAFKRHSDVEIGVVSFAGGIVRWNSLDSGEDLWRAVQEPAESEENVPVSPAQFEAIEGLFEGGMAFEVGEDGALSIVEDDS